MLHVDIKALCNAYILNGCFTPKGWTSCAVADVDAICAISLEMNVWIFRWYHPEFLQDVILRLHLAQQSFGFCTA